MSRIKQVFERKNKEILSIYFTAGFPALHSTKTIIEALSRSGADLVEIGIPFSDPMADGPVIQQSSEQAITNGMRLSLLFKQLRELKNEQEMPLILMGYLNPILQYGISNFLDDCVTCKIDGVIIPDLPPDVFKAQYQSLFAEKRISIIFLVAPQTPVARVHEIDALTNAFIYMVTTPGTTGKSGVFTAQDLRYFEAVKNMNLKNPVLAGFGIQDKRGFQEVCRYVNGAIIGSSFIQKLSEHPEDITTTIQQFIQSIRS